MKIIWRDTDLKSHEIDLANAVDVKIDGMTLTSGEGIKIHADNQLEVLPIASNAIIVKERR